MTIREGKPAEAPGATPRDTRRMVIEAGYALPALKSCIRGRTPRAPPTRVGIISRIVEVCAQG